MKNVNLKKKKEIILKRSSLVFSSQILLADKQEMKTTSLARATQGITSTDQNVQTDISCSVDLYNRAAGWEEEATGNKKQKNLQSEMIQRCRSQRQIDASSHTAIRMLLSRLKLVCRMADVHLGRVSVMHLGSRDEKQSSISYSRNLIRFLLVLTIRLLLTVKFILLNLSTTTFKNRPSDGEFYD